MFNSELLLKIKIKNIIGNINPGEMCGITTDSRNINGEQVFLAIGGDKFDGFNFVETAVEKNCRYIIYDFKQERVDELNQLHKKHPGKTFVGVANTLETIAELASLHRKGWSGKLIGITGSNGKTTTKEMLTSILSSVFPGKVIATKGNLNNHIGVPLTLLRMGNEHEFAVVEIGTNHPGEIKYLCDIAEPNAGIITSIGESHLEFFETKDNVFKEKSSLYHAVRKANGFFVCNIDDFFLDKLEVSDKVITFAKNKGKFKYQFNGVDEIQLSSNQQKYYFKNSNVFGEFNFLNLISSFLLSIHLAPNKVKELEQATSQVKLPSNNRSEWLQKDSLNIFKDAYNANPSSMRASLAAFETYIANKKIDKEKCFVVLGDMNELGNNAPTYHNEIGVYLKQFGFKKIAFIGRYSRYYKEGFNGGLIFDSARDFATFWQEQKKNYAYLYLKGSRTLQLESIIDIT